MPGVIAGKPRRRDLTLGERAVIDFNRQRIETQRHLAEKYSLENQITRAEVLKRAEVAKGLAGLADAIASRIMASSLEQGIKDDILKELASIPFVLEEVAHGQTRLTKKNKETEAHRTAKTKG